MPLTKQIHETPALPQETLRAAMRRAAAEARKYLGATSPNPAVGAAALNAAGEVIGINAHKRAGTPHAEAGLLADFGAAGHLADIHTLCVTLEPCNHHGRTGPCAEAIIAAGIKRVAIGTRDPNPIAQGGVARLKAADIDVIENVEAEECRQLLHAFAYHAITGKPWITIKRAFTRGGSMTPPPGQKTFTSPESLRLAHRLRKKADAIITGSGTVIADNPLFNVRHVVDHADKRRALAIMDRRHRVPDEYLAAARTRGLDAFRHDQCCDSIVQELVDRGARDVLVEAGPLLSDAFRKPGTWNMAVDIHQAEPGAPDRVDIAFNTAAPLPFNTAQFNWEWVLPG